MFCSYCIFNGIRLRQLLCKIYCGNSVLRLCTAVRQEKCCCYGRIYFALNVFVNIIRIGVQHAYPKEVAIDHIYATFAIGLLIVLIYATTSVAEQFKRDTEGSLKEQHEKQKVMVRDILEVAHEVSEGTRMP